MNLRIEREFGLNNFRNENGLEVENDNSMSKHYAFPLLMFLLLYFYDMKHFLAINS